MKSMYVLIIISAFLASQCGTFNVHQPKKDWALLDKWDKNGNKSLDMGEFVEGYDDARFFTKWNERARPIEDSVFMYRTFQFLDRDHNGDLDSTEYVSRRVLWTFRGVRVLRGWDKNRDKIITLDEFIQKAQSENIAREFDFSGDGQITESEMAQGMFEVCDKNDDNTVKGMEFYLWEVYRR